jgi:glycerophosphoryl diester phosphodiesterase
MFKKFVLCVSVFLLSNLICSNANCDNWWGHSVQLGPRPFYLISDMDDSPLKHQLQQCGHGPFHRTSFSIGHRGACLQFPEHTKESYEAAAVMGAGIIECDVTFTKDKALVCRHSQCDLHTTTNILEIPELAAKCSQPFKSAEFDVNGTLTKSASAKCCTSDITLEEFKKLKGKMDASDPKAKTVSDYVKLIPSSRTDLYTQKGTLMTHAESIELFKSLGVKMTPELKSPEAPMPYDKDYTQEKFAQQMIDEYKKAGVDPSNVYAQSFNLNDILYWLKKEPRFGKQAVYLDGRYDIKSFDLKKPETWSPSMEELFAKGVRIIAPPMQFLVDVDKANKSIVPSLYAIKAKESGLEIITWTLDRSGLLKTGGGFYYSTVSELINNDGDMYEVLDVLATQVGILGIFSDWPATVTYYANCKGY